MFRNVGNEIYKNSDKHYEEYGIFEKIKSILLNKMYDIYIYEDSILKILESSVFTPIQYIQLVAGFISTFLVVGGRKTFYLIVDLIK